MSDIDWDTRNVLLTLARIWSTLETDSLRSKADAASYSFEKLPNEYKPVLERAKAILLGETEENWEDINELIEPCAKFMVEQIKKETDLVIASDFSQRKLKIL
jgi:streptomycin 3"-adenylyltransferase